jgi:hypothetical protein
VTLGMAPCVRVLRQPRSGSLSFCLWRLRMALAVGSCALCRRRWENNSNEENLCWLLCLWCSALCSPSVPGAYSPLLQPPLSLIREKARFASFFALSVVHDG